MTFVQWLGISVAVWFLFFGIATGIDGWKNWKRAAEFGFSGTVALVAPFFIVWLLSPFSIT